MSTPEDSGYGAKLTKLRYDKKKQEVVVLGPGAGSGSSIKCVYTPEFGQIVCDLMIAGWKMVDFDDPEKRRAWSDGEGCGRTLPVQALVYKWVYVPNLAPGFPEMYKRARDITVHQLVNETIDIADTDRTDMVAVQAAKNRIAARQWIASRIHRAEYGDRVDQNINVTHELSSKSTEELRAKLEYLRGQTPELPAITVEAVTVEAEPAKEKKG